MNQTVLAGTNGWSTTKLSFDNGGLVMHLSDQSTVKTNKLSAHDVNDFSMTLSLADDPKLDSSIYSIEYKNVTIICYISPNSDLAVANFVYKILINDQHRVDAGAFQHSDVSDCAKYTVNGSINNQSGNKPRPIYVHFLNVGAPQRAEMGSINFFFSVDFNKTVTLNGENSGSKPTVLQVTTTQLS